MTPIILMMIVRCIQSDTYEYRLIATTISIKAWQNIFPIKIVLTLGDMVHSKRLVRWRRRNSALFHKIQFSNSFNWCTDRKPEDIFVFKSFIFSNVPDEWSFGAKEMLQGMQQIIDITDDITGKPSDLARKEIPMYGEYYFYAGNKVDWRLVPSVYILLRTARL